MLNVPFQKSKLFESVTIQVLLYNSVEMYIDATNSVNCTACTKIQSAGDSSKFLTQGTYMYHTAVSVNKP